VSAERVREIDLHLTNRCNLTCAHCSVDSGPRRSVWGDMPVEAWVEVIQDAAGLGCRHADLTGGEPILYDGVEQIIEKILLAGMQLELQSNGILLTPERLKILRRSGLPTLVISLDGLARQHDLIRGRFGAHERALAAIRDAISAGFQVRVTRVMTGPETFLDFRDFAKELDGLGVSHLSLNMFSPVTPTHFSSFRKPDPAVWLEFIDGVEQTAKEVSFFITYELAYARPSEVAELMVEETRCLIERRRWFLIRSDGEVFPCYHFVHRPEMSIGNVREAPLSALIEDRVGKWTAYAGIHETPTGCKHCRFASTCGGGCPSPGYLRSSSLSIKDMRCDIERGYVPLCPFVKRTAGTRHVTNISPYYYASEMSEQSESPGRA
jgi:radical SAM protein with 4Fe4S-binding SPASM domain